MNFFSFNWIQPLQKRVEEELPKESNSFLKAWSIVSPVLIYYMVNTVSQSFLALIVPGIANGLAMLIASAVMYKSFLMETPQIKMPELHKKESPLLFILGGAAALCFNILFGLLQITGSSQDYAEVADKQFALPLWAGLLLYGIISPWAEEVVFRGIVYNRYYRLFGRPVALVGSALLFGVYHGNIVQALYGFVLGLLMAVLYERYGAFIVPVLLHSAANIFVYVVSASTELQMKLMNWYGCIGCGLLTVILFWLLVLRKERKYSP